MASAEELATSASSAEGWAKILEPTSTSEEDKRVMQLSQDYKKEITLSKGVKVFLQRMLADPKTKCSFHDALTRSMLPLSPTIAYQRTRPLPTHDEKAPTTSMFILHLGDFAYDAAASLLMDPEVPRSHEFIDRFITEGFVTNDSPIMVSNRSNVGDNSITMFNVGYMKGQTRVLTYLGFLLYLWVHEEEVPNQLLKGGATIHCKCIAVRDDQSEVFTAMSAANRGAMRKAPTVLGWGKTLSNLQRRNQSIVPVSVVADWNKMAPKADKIIGGKAIAVSNVLALPAEALKMIMDIGNALGADKIFTDDNLSSKKLKEGYSFKGRSLSKSKWAKYGVVTEPSLILLFQYMASLGCKMTKVDMEKSLEQVTLATHCYDEVIFAAPDLATKMTDDFLNLIRSGDCMIMAQLSNALDTKDEKFLPRDIPAIGLVINKGSVKSIEALNDLESQLRDTQCAIDQDSFNLATKELVEFDTPAIRIYYRNLMEFNQAAASQRDMWKSKVRKHDLMQCQAYLQRIHNVEVS